MGRRLRLELRNSDFGSFLEEAVSDAFANNLRTISRAGIVSRLAEEAQ